MGIKKTFDYLCFFGILVIYFPTEAETRFLFDTDLVEQWSTTELKSYFLGNVEASTGGARIVSRFRPGGESREVTIVNVTIDLLGLADVSEWEMNYRVSLELMQAWYQPKWAYATIFAGRRNDEYLEFDPEAEFPHIWTPTTYFVNEMTEEKSAFKWQKIVRYDLSKHKITKPNVVCRLYGNGTIILIERATVRLGCLMDLGNFPMDQQGCPITLSSYSYAENEVEYVWDYDRRGPIHLPHHGVSLAEYSVSGIDVGKCHLHRKSGDFPCVEATLFLKRNPSSYIMQFYLPSSMFVCLSWLSFYVDMDSIGGRVYFAVFLVVTMVGQMMYILSRVPPVSYVKAIDVWMDVCLVFVSLVLVEYAVVKVKMASAQLKGLKLESHFEEEDDDDVSVEDIMPEVVKPTEINTKKNNRKEIPATKVSSTLIARPRSFSKKEAREAKFSKKLQNIKGPGRLSRMKSRFSESIERMRRNEAHFIDVISRILFPFFFGLFNVFYWSYYLGQRK